MTNKQWNQLRTDRTITIGSNVVKWDAVLLDSIPHVVHEYANFVSSAKMRETGEHRGKRLSRLSIHISLTRFC